MKRMNLFAAILSIALCLGLSGPAAATDAPAPGTVINKGNIDQYKDFFPKFWLDAFRSGFDGFISPLSITIAAPSSNPFPGEFLNASKANKGKYSVDADGYITGGPFEEIVGFPFPEVKPDDENFVIKLMWNYDYKYTFDDQSGHFLNYEKRVGGKPAISTVQSWQISFQNRMFMDPKPLFETSQGYRSANLMRQLTPPVSRNFINLLIRYIDQRAADTMYMYLPSMRRVLRGEAGERSTPIMSSTQSPDDFTGGFAGRIPEFTYDLVADTTIIGQGESKWDYSYIMKEKTNAAYLPVEPDGWQLRDVYVIDITPKNEKYPQSKKRIWLNKETLMPLYACAWDRQGKLWKIWQTPLSKHPNQSVPGETVPYFPGMLGIDLQLGYGVQMFAEWKMNENGVTDNDISIASLRKLGC